MFRAPNAKENQTMKQLLAMAAVAAFSFGLAAMDLPVQNSDFVQTNGKLTGWNKSVQPKN